MDTIAIFGVGLIGGSFALALRAAGFSGRILGVSSESTLSRALERRIIDAAANPEEAAHTADVLYLAQPVRAILESLPKLNDWVRPETLVTDVGSTKKAIVQRAAETLTRAQFLGGHPLAGKESRGIDSAVAGLFRGRTYVLTPNPTSSFEEQLDTPGSRDLQNWLVRIGAIPLIMDAETHDQTVAFTSHLPQLASTALALVLGQRSLTEAGVFGPALLESTRLALSPHEIWADILATNSGPIDLALSEFIGALELLRRDLNAPAMAGHFHAAGSLARRIRDRANQSSS